MAVREIAPNPSLLQAQLPRRLARLCRRGQRLQDGWDVNTLALLGEDARFLATNLRGSGTDAVAAALAALDAAVAPLLDPPQTPDHAGMARLAARIAALTQLDPSELDTADAQAHAANAGPTHADGFPLQVIPPANYWQRFADSATVPFAAASSSPIETVDDDLLEAMIAAAHASAEPRAAPAPISSNSGSSNNGDRDRAAARSATPPAELDLLDRLRLALEGDGLQLMFQAIVPLHGESVEQFQALLRLRGEDGRVHTAAELIPLAEQAGLLGAIDRWVLERCIEVVTQRLQAGRPLRLLVSQSLHSVRNAWATTRLERLLGEQPLVAPAIALELHAQDAIAAPAEVARYANAVKAFGAGFVVSGFEAGALGERLLAELPFDAVRLAPGHLQLADASQREQLRKWVERLHEHGRSVIAPRVEDARAASALWAAGVDYVQGNFVQAADSDLGFDFRGSIM